MKIIKSSLFVLLLVITGNAAAESTTAAVSKANCGKLANTTQPFVLILDKGDKLHDSISQCAKDAKLMGAAVMGIGQVLNPTLAYFNTDPHAKPKLTAFKDVYELASINGDITHNDGQYYTHVHTVLADKQFHAIAGHLDSATVGLTAEITIVPYSASVQRTVDPATGFGPIVH